jgi:hypothetical protein
MTRAEQIEAAAEGKGHYPVDRTPDNPGDDPTVIHRYGVDTEDGLVFVKARWAEGRVVAYSVETRDDGKVPAPHFHKKLVDSVKAHIESD